MKDYEVRIPGQNVVIVTAKNVAGAKASARQCFGLAQCPKGTIVKETV